MDPVKSPFYDIPVNVMVLQSILLSR
jgi:hypothetical protein